MFQKGSEIEVKIEKSVFEGKSIARVNGFVLFVRNVVPGDVVKVRDKVYFQNLYQMLCRGFQCKLSL